jgi:hypothetical protein
MITENRLRGLAGLKDHRRGRLRQRDQDTPLLHGGSIAVTRFWNKKNG